MFIFSKCIRQWKRVVHKLSINKKLHSLTPSDNAEKINPYLKTLNWALLNSKSIKNIAISGPYGAGKSSIIDTYIKKNKCTHKYLKISLATFQDLSGEKKFPSDKEKLERLIELSLLQQLLYHEKDKNIPDSRFQKIKKTRKLFLYFFVFLIVVFIISFAYVFPSNIVSNFIEKYTPFYESFKFFFNSRVWIKSVLSTYIFVFLVCCIYRAIKLIFNISTIKLFIPHTEIEIGKGISKSALNTYLDEILYFFEVSKYEVVFIEDLDRFDQSDIFVKLRELNRLINNSKKVKQDVVFVYAIKDDMFLNKERTKFFDFIIPVIPVINNSNSKDKLKTILADSKYEIADDLISDISIFIDDMRLLYNILNEFYLYEQILNKSDLNANCLLAIISYKNLFPNDFVNLMQNKGVLYKTINKKREYIEAKKEEIDEKIKEVQGEIEASKKQIQKDIKELRLLYVGALYSYMLSHYPDFVHFTKQTGNIKIEYVDLAIDENFELIKSGSMYYYRNGYGRNSLTYNFHDIEKIIDSSESYEKKESNLKNRLNPSSLYKSIDQLKNEKEESQKEKLKDLIVKEKIIVSDEKDVKEDFIYRLLRSGYINENYLDYISIFHEGTLHKSDYEFLLKVKRGIPVNAEDKLIAKDELIKQINKFDFEKESVLNYDLVDALIGNDKEIEKQEILLKQLSNGSEKSIEFVNSFINITEHLELFIESLCSAWNDIWKSLSVNTKLDVKRKRTWFELIIKYANIDSIDAIFQDNTSFIAEYEDFFFICENTQKLEEIVSILNIKFKEINRDTTKDELDFIFDNCFFEFNSSIVEFLISRKIALNESYYTSNYKFIMSCEIDSLKKYVNDSINEYITNLYLNIENNTNEELNSYILLLNNASMKLNIKEKLIQKVETCVDDIKKIENIDVQDLLFIFNKLNVSWENVYQNYKNHEDNLSESVINYLNNYEIAKHLSTIKISNAKDDEGNVIYGNFVKSLIHEEKINDENYSFITKSSPWWYSEFDTEKLTPERISILIKNNCVNPTQTAFSYLRTNFDGKQIELFEKQPQKFTENLEELELTVNEAEKIIELDSINKEIKYSCIKQLSEDDISSSIVICRFITNTFTPNSDFDFSDEIKFNLLLNEEIETSERIKFFKYNHSSLDSDEISEFIKSLGKEYEEITNKHKHAEISKNEANRVLLDVLKEVGYISSKSETKNGYRVNHHTMK